MVYGQPRAAKVQLELPRPLEIRRGFNSNPRQGASCGQPRGPGVLELVSLASTRKRRQRKLRYDWALVLGGGGQHASCSDARHLTSEVDHISVHFLLAVRQERAR